MNIDLKKIGTEKRNLRTIHIDQMSTEEMVRAMNEEDKIVAYAVEAVLPQIAKTVDAIVKTFEAGGRMIYLGAGTSGRIGLIDAVECQPTFSVSPDMVQCIMAGGMKAMVKAVEGAEDNKVMAVEDLKAINLSNLDIVIGIAASGRTPYVIGGIEYAKKLGCLTSCIVTSVNSELASLVSYPIEAITGAEPLTGSTRMKSGTAQKMICNMLSTASMIKMGKVYENLMIDVQATNEKLVKRAQSILEEALQISNEEATLLLQKYHTVKKALFSQLSGIQDEITIDQFLNAAGGNIHKALKEAGK
ncbi:MAG: N-acetylmuramic acid 6-phosphate etherase [Bacilli bacterium]|nr:N-acetylmuramic acid 6-phosphate etherase [Bacilli bacterium]